MNNNKQVPNKGETQRSPFTTKTLQTEQNNNSNSYVV